MTRTKVHVTKVCVTKVMSFRILSEADDFIEAVRQDQPDQLVRELKRSARWFDVDLHGLTWVEAEDELKDAFQDARARGATRIRIVTGKGRHSQGGLPVLRTKVIGALKQGKYGVVVLAFCTAPQNMGGSGAILVALK